METVQDLDLEDLRRVVLLHRLEYRDSSAAQISRVIERIPAMRALLLEQVSSSYYSLGSDVSVHRAVVAIGIDRVTTLAQNEARQTFAARRTVLERPHLTAASYAAAAAAAFGAPPLDAFPIALCRALLSGVEEANRELLGDQLCQRIGLMRLDRILGDWTKRGSLSPGLERSVALGLYKADLGPSTPGVQDFDAAAQSSARRIEAIVSQCFEPIADDESAPARI